MPARNRVGLSENTRKRIQTSMIVKRLESHILGEIDLTSTQVRSAEVLLRKTLPDLASIDLNAVVNGDHTLTIKWADGSD